jgi:hypothetical protein
VRPDRKRYVAFMKTLQKLSMIAAAALIVSGCTTYGDPTTFGSLSCESLRTLYSPGTNIGNTPDILASESSYNHPKPNEITLANANLARNQTAKRESDLRAAYKANGC